MLLEEDLNKEKLKEEEIEKKRKIYSEDGLKELLETKKKGDQQWD